MERSNAAAAMFGVAAIMKYMTPRTYQTMDLHAGIDETAMVLTLRPEITVRPKVDLNKPKRALACPKLV